MYRNLMKGLLPATLIAISSMAWAADSPHPTSQDAPGSPTAQVVTLDDAITRALANSARLQVAEAAMAATRGEQQQAQSWPNPSLGIEAENIGGQGEYSGFSSAEITYGVSQLVELGGKRSARQEAASHAYAVARADYEAARLDLIRDVSIAYAEAIAAKEGVALAGKQRTLAAEVLKNVTGRVAAAAEPLFRKSKSEVALATSEIAFDRAKRDYSIARKQLAALWGSVDANFDLESSHFSEIGQPVTLWETGADSPAMRRWQAEVNRNRAAYDLEEAGAIPDPTFSAGVKDFQATGDKAFVVGVSVPIPLFNRNQGNIAKAHSNVTKATSEKRAAEIALALDLTRTQEELENAYRLAQSLKNTIMPAAEDAYVQSRRGYGAGKFPYLEVLDAQRTLVEARAQYNDALKTYHIKRAELQRLTAKYEGAPIEKDDAHAD